jgi:hypothetical protein
MAVVPAWRARRGSRAADRGSSTERLQRACACDACKTRDIEAACQAEQDVARAPREAGGAARVEDRRLARAALRS